MADVTGTPNPNLRPEAVIATAQHGLACWSRAWTQVAHGLMSAGMAHMDLARSMCGTNPNDWAHTFRPGNSPEEARELLHATRARFDTALHGYRRINDELAASFFVAAESLCDGMATEAGKTGTGEPSGANVSAAMVRPPVAPAMQRKA